MDTIPYKKFMGIFGRTKVKIPHKGCTNAWDINMRILKAYYSEKDRLKKEKNSKIIKRLRWSMGHLKTLVISGYGRRVIDEAQADPNGIINLTLMHGYREAEEIKLSRFRKGKKMRRI